MSDSILEVAAELFMMSALRLVALWLSNRLLGVRMNVRRLLALAAVALLGAVVGDVLGSALSLRGIAGRLMAETTQAGILAVAVVNATQASVAKGAAVAIVTGLAGLLLLVSVELLWMLVVFAA